MDFRSTYGKDWLLRSLVNRSGSTYPLSLWCTFLSALNPVEDIGLDRSRLLIPPRLWIASHTKGSGRWQTLKYIRVNAVRVISTFPLKHMSLRRTFPYLVTWISPALALSFSNTLFFSHHHIHSAPCSLRPQLFIYTYKRGVSEQLWKPLKPFPFTLHTLALSLLIPARCKLLKLCGRKNLRCTLFLLFLTAVDEWKRSAPAPHVETHTVRAHTFEKSAFLNGLKLFSTTIRFQFKQSAWLVLKCCCGTVAFLYAPNTFYYAPEREEENKRCKEQVNYTCVFRR